VPKAHQSLAFADLEIPLPPHSHPSQCMLSPKVEARMLQDLAVQKHEKVLEIGTGSGYMAALLAHRAQQVISLEIEPSLAASARDHLRQAGIYNAQVLEQDGSKPLSAPELAGSFDVILLSASVAEIPASLKAKLKVGGRLMAIVGNEPVMSATLLTRLGESQFRTEQNWETVAPRLQHFPEPSAFRF
jgi:protein-L-isoaspartate(D-aspartate) O-methyltransferase